MSATGKALAVVAAMLHRSGVATPSQFGDLLRAVATAVAATEPTQHRVLTSWSDTVSLAGDLERSMLLANGEALATLRTLLDQGGVAPPGEFGSLLGLFACVTAETEPDEGDILGYWAAVVVDSFKSDEDVALRP